MKLAKFIVLVLFVPASVVVGQLEEPQEPAKDTPPAPTVESILKQAAEEKAAADKVLAEAQAAHQKAVQEAETKAIEGIKTLAKQQAAAGDIAKASKIWEEVLQVNIQDQDAADYFKAIGRGDVVRKAKGELAKSMKWVEFVESGGRVFKRMPDGTWSDSDSQKGSPLVEIKRTDWYVLLERTKDGNQHWYFEDQFLWKKKGESSWKFATTGRWVK